MHVVTETSSSVRPYVPSKSVLLRASEKLGHNAAGRWLISKAVCAKAPYFFSVNPRFTRLEPGHAEAVVKNRWFRRNHIGTVHAIALCNAAEFVGGVCMEMSLRGDMRWIPVGMEVEYLTTAKTAIRAVCTMPDYERWSEPADITAPVDIYDTNDTLVFRARIKMRISNRKS